MSESVRRISEFGERPDQRQEADDTPLYMDHTETGVIPQGHFRHLAIQGIQDYYQIITVPLSKHIFEKATTQKRVDRHVHIIRCSANGYEDYTAATQQDTDSGDIYLVLG